MFLLAGYSSTLREAGQEELRAETERQVERGWEVLTWGFPEGVLGSLTGAGRQAAPRGAVWYGRKKLNRKNSVDPAHLLCNIE